MRKRPRPSVDEIWEGFARSRPEFYILTQEMSFTRPDVEWFFASGRRDAEMILADVGSNLVRKLCTIDIGCGVGRLAIPMAAHFDEVIGVDVSQTMLEHLAANCRSAGIENVRPSHVEDPWDEHRRADLVFSRIVFQHIEDEKPIERYARRIQRALTPDGIAHLQFDTRPRTFIYRVGVRVPDAVLPREWRRGVRRIRRSSGWLRAIFEAAGLHVLREFRPDTDDHVFVLKRLGSSSAHQ